VKTEVSLYQIYAAAGQKKEIKKIISEVETGKLSANDNRGVALIYAALGENDKAFYWLDKSYDMHEEALCSLKIDPKLDTLRSDPRFR
jgi:hypothetical protein